MTNFVGMKQTLPEYIKQNDELRQILLAQEGGIMKYLAEHLDADGTADLFSGYQDYCVDLFFERNKWDYNVVWEGDDMRRAALGASEHLMKELKYYTTLKPQLVTMPNEVTKRIDWFVDQYLTYAYRKNRQRWYPNGMTAREVYREVIGIYSFGGLAYKSMEILLKEHHANGEIEKSESEQLTKFLIRQYSDQLTLGVFSQMRQAVAEILIGKTPEQCRQMAIDTMLSVRGFSQMIYTDEVVRSLRRRKLKTRAEQRKKDGEWLRDVAEHAPFEEYRSRSRKSSLRSCFANFVNLLKEVGRIWAAQLLIRSIDMHKLEKEVCCILSPSDNPQYYVDRYFTDDLPDMYCISNNEMAEKKLSELGRKRMKSCYLTVADETMEVEVRKLLSKAYNKFKQEGFLNDSTAQMTFVDVLMGNDDGKIVWQNDPMYRYLRTFIKILLGIQNDYSYGPLLKANKGKNYTPFIRSHFLDEKGEPINFTSNGHDVGKKDKDSRFNAIVDFIFG